MNVKKDIISKKRIFFCCERRELRFTIVIYSIMANDAKYRIVLNRMCPVLPPEREKSNVPFKTCIRLSKDPFKMPVKEKLGKKMLSDKF